jgi:branched-subunit amino acid aminotransferase/4-amino-4-deoxychorismate lyase
MSEYYIYNNQFYKETDNVISINRHSIKYGDGLFETMKVEYFVLMLRQYHFERLYNGLKALDIEVPSYFDPVFIEQKMRELLDRNEHVGMARLRLTVFRDADNLFDVNNSFNYILQSFPLQQFEELNDKGLILGVYRDWRKPCDIFSNIKSNSSLPYVMAGRFAGKNKLSDSVILNMYDRVCETTIANIFIIKDNVISTPSLGEGSVAGVMRRHVMLQLSRHYNVLEKEITPRELWEADEVFLTNTIRGIRWVEKFEGKKYKHEEIDRIWTRVFEQ